jgi:Ser/Thr protein kinase RdoA (MazF antagonist)
MDDQFTYLLNGLLTRHFGLGRIARFRQVARGRQAATYELLTAQQNEYLVYLYPPTFTADHLAFMASAVNRLDEARFSVMPFMKAKTGETVVPGPQQTHLLVGLNPIGAPLPADQWTAHQRADLGLRLAWLHRALREELPAAESAESLADELEDSRALPPDRLPRNHPAIPAGHLDSLAADLADHHHDTLAYIHGDLAPDSLLLDADAQLRFFLDWGLLRPGTPAEDLFWIFAHFCRADPAVMRPVLEAYTSLEPLSPVAMRIGVTRALARRIIEARAGRTALRPALDLLDQRTALVAALEEARP